MRIGNIGSVLIVALIRISLPAHADPVQPMTTALAGKIEFEICRVPGTVDELADASLEIPAGSEFRERTAPAGDPTATTASTSPPVIVVTTRATSLPADRYCVSVPVKLSPGTNDRALEATVGDMFRPVGHPANPADFDPLYLTYGILKSKVF
jgi:hypothetical protein